MQQRRAGRKKHMRTARERGGEDERARCGCTCNPCRLLFRCWPIPARGWHDMHAGILHLVSSTAERQIEAG